MEQLRPVEKTIECCLAEAQPDYAKQVKDFAKYTKLRPEHLTNREIVTKKLQDLLIVIGIGSFVGFLSPYGMNKLSLLTSILYWNTVCIAGYFVYHPIISFAETHLEKPIPTHWHRVAIGSLISSIPMSFVVPLVTYLFFDYSRPIWQQFVDVLPKAIVIGGVISLISMVKDILIEQKTELNKTQAKDQEQLDKFMALLPVEKRGVLYCFVSEDHYLKVYTDKGHHLILMRFKDAVDMLNEYPGIQTHRSWWVALDAIQSVTKENRKTLLSLTNQVQVPVSKTYSEAVRHAGVH
ncbi:LytTR family transcriptional regulator [Paraglaciecola aquimarina]|uniref:LytTR family transcriptional regulator n=1 Tax=Paraglaciecola algarum TaxID=3050085 RepID=A0ABS9D914_9ALTE|nr:LytTR family DNA-binding domain-containing protein [Paraglaciecola sp. G1-23]MCF2949409.1 LytTR family transcriptional regulator [Paraglaciecola sp. G1-23]